MLKCRFLLFAFLIYSCGDPVDEFVGFNKSQVEFLLAGEDGKDWEIASRRENGTEITLSECESQYQYIFMPNSADIKPLLLRRDVENCDSAQFCAQFPQYCVANDFNCNLNPDYCANFDEDVLFVGYWEVKSKVLTSTRTDTVYLYFANEKRTMDIQLITSQLASFKFEPAGSDDTIYEEDYIHLNEDSDL